MFCDARNPDSVAGVLLTLIRHVVALASDDSALLDA